jgi:hypothetical protein
MTTAEGSGTAIPARSRTGFTPAPTDVAANTHDIRKAVPRRTRPGLPVIS